MKKYASPPWRGCEKQAPATVGFNYRENRFFNCYPLPSSKWDMLDILDIYCIYWIYCTYKKHTSCKMNWLDRENAKGGGGGFENRGFSGKSNYKVPILTKTWHYRTSHAVILPLALCRKHVFQDAVFEVNLRQQNMLFYHGLCSHVALGTLSETYLKDAVF